MLVNNFKPLLWFGWQGTFKNVLGNTVNLSGYMPGITSNNVRNAYQYRGLRSFNYNYTSTTNSFTAEQTTYAWADITQYSTGSSEPQLCSTGFVLFVGTGDTAVTADDYKLDTPITLAVTGAGCYHKADGTTVITRTFQNNTESEVTIKELGLYMFRCSGTSTPIVMLGRKVLTTPVVIPVGASYTFTWTIDLLKNVNLNDEE